LHYSLVFISLLCTFTITSIRVLSIFNRMIKPQAMRLLFLLICTCVLSNAGVAQQHDADSSRSVTLTQYLKFAHPLGSVKLDFPGPYGGFTFVHLPTKEIMEWGDTVVKDHVYLIDMNVSHDGTFLA